MYAIRRWNIWFGSVLNLTQQNYVILDTHLEFILNLTFSTTSEMYGLVIIDAISSSDGHATLNFITSFLSFVYTFNLKQKKYNTSEKLCRDCHGLFDSWCCYMLKGQMVWSKKCMFQKWTICWQNKSLIYVFWWGLIFHLISVSDRGEMQFDRKVGFEWGSCHSQKLSNDLGATSRSGAFNDLAQININTKPWSYYNQIELMCSVNW